MTALLKMTWMEMKLFLREPLAAFFTLAFPLMVLFVFGSIFGNDPFPGADVGSVDVSTPGYIAFIIGTTAFMNIPVSMATYRENGILRRFRASPVPPGLILGAQVLVYVLMSVLGVVVLVIAARVFFDLRLPDAPFALMVAFLLAMASFFSLGTVLASVLPTPRSAQAVGSALFFPMMFLSGAAFPRSLMPDTVLAISDVLPLTHITLLLSDLWFGGTWNTVSLLVLGGLFVVGLVASVLTFKWE